MNAQEHEPRRIVRFGLFELDRKSKELHRNGMTIKLSAQSFQVLILLLEHAGDVVTREELRQQLWPKDTFVDFDHGLNAAIKRLRDALGDAAESSARSLLIALLWCKARSLTPCRLPIFCISVHSKGS